MDSASQTSSADDDITKLSGSCSSICLSDTTVGETSGGCCAKDLVEKLMLQFNEKDEIMAQLKEKDQQLEKKQNEIMELQDKLDVEKAQTMQLKTAMNELKAKLGIAETKQMEYQQIILWKSFPLPHLCYYIKVLRFYLYADKDGNLLTSSDDRPFPSTGHFKFTKHPNGTFSIYSISQEKYLESKLNKTEQYGNQTSFIFSANDCSTPNTKFELFFLQHKDTKLAAGISEYNWTNIVANSPTAPTNKFWIIPVDGQ